MQFIWPVEIDLHDASWHEDVRREWAMTLATSQQADSTVKEEAAAQLVSGTDGHGRAFIDKLIQLARNRRQAASEVSTGTDSHPHTDNESLA